MLHWIALANPTMRLMFGLAPLDSKSDWMLVLGFALPVLLVEEILKVMS